MIVFSTEGAMLWYMYCKNCQGQGEILMMKKSLMDLTEISSSGACRARNFDSVDVKLRPFFDFLS